MDRANVAATFHERQCTDSRFGYTQGSGRWGSGATEEWECDGVTGVFTIGDRDCSSSVIDCWNEALRGSEYEDALSAATYTGNMRSVFVNSGLFDWHPMGDGYVAKRGDVYLNEKSHTAMCQSDVPDMLSEFSINELGTITGGEVGDQTGNESHVRAYYDFPWDGILAYNGKADDMSLSDSDIDRIADRVWRYMLSSEDGDADAGNYMREIRKNSRELVRTDDPSGRGVAMNTHEHLKWIAAKQSEIFAKISDLVDELETEK